MTGSSHPLEDDDRSVPLPPAEKPKPATGTKPRPSADAPSLASGVQIGEMLPPISEPEVALPVPPGDFQALQKGLERAGPGAAAATPADAGRSVAAQLVVAVQADHQGGFEVHLSPEELGRVKLSLHVVDGAVALAIQAERPETLDLMRRHIDVLEREFREAGFASMSFSFGQGSPNGRPRSPTYADILSEASPAHTSPIAPLPGPASAKTSSRLDLRL